MPAAPVRPRRSCLYMPGGNARALEKARSLPADMVIFDLEDAVSPGDKDAARAAVAAAVAARPYGARPYGTRPYGTREVVVRINGLDTPWAQQDITAIAAARPDGILLPKVASASDIIDANAALDTALDAAGADAAIGLWAMIEMPRAILHIAEIAATSHATRLCGFVMGTNDLAKELRAVPTPGRCAFQTALSLTVAAARAYNLCAIDSVYNDFNDAAGLESECDQGRILGFDGKTLIHPSQLDTANRIFAPSPEAIEAAQHIIAAFADPANHGKGVLTINGTMTERLHLEQAQQLMMMHEAIGN